VQIVTFNGLIAHELHPAGGVHTAELTQFDGDAFETINPELQVVHCSPEIVVLNTQA
jgi:hypothetical protein